MRARRKIGPVSGGNSHWIPYADMMAGLMLVFSLVMVFSIFQYMEAEKTKRDEVAQREARLQEQQEELQAQQDKLEANELVLILAQAQLQAQQDKLDVNEMSLTLAQAQLLTQRGALDASEADLALAQAQLRTQQDDLAEKDQQLQSAQRRIVSLIGVRTRIITDLDQKLREAGLSVAVDKQTGAIAFTGSVLFDVNQSSLKREGMVLLDTFVPVYVRTLLADYNREYVGEIIIEGHTDSDGPFLDNLRLSQDRAYAVARYCLRDGFGDLTGEERELLRAIMTANGRSWSNLIYKPDGREDKEASRRVVFKFRLKETEMIDEMRGIFESTRQGEAVPR
jgi:chemotaxis protein MotB